MPYVTFQERFGILIVTGRRDIQEILSIHLASHGSPKRASMLERSASKNINPEILKALNASLWWYVPGDSYVVPFWVVHYTP